MKPYGNQLNFKKKVSYESKKNSEKISIIDVKLIHQIFDTINISLLVLIFTLSFLSFDSPGNTILAAELEPLSNVSSVLTLTLSYVFC